MPSDTEQAPAAINPDDLQVDVQKVLNSYARQIAEQAGKIALLEASNETLQEEKNALIHQVVELNAQIPKEKVEHNGRVTKGKTKKGK